MRFFSIVILVLLSVAAMAQQPSREELEQRRKQLERRQQQGPPVADPGELQQEPGREGAHHVLRAVREVDDVQEPEDHGEPEREQRVERAIDEPDQELAEEGLGRDAEDLGHGI